MNDESSLVSSDTTYINELNARVEPCGTYVLTPKDCVRLLWWDFLFFNAKCRIKER